MEDQDRDIIKALQRPAGRERAFRQMVVRYQKPLYAQVRRITGNHEDADDALQNTFLKVWRHIDGFRGDSSLFTWLYRIATNEALTLRKRQQKGQMEINEATLSGANTDAPESDEIIAKLDAARETLPDKQRLIFDLRYYDEMPYQEIAELTGTSVGALKASYFHAARKVEAFLTR